MFVTDETKADRATEPACTPAVADAQRALHAAQRAESVLSQFLRDLERIAGERSLLGIGVAGNKNLAHTAKFVADDFQRCVPVAVAAVYGLLATVRHAGDHADERLRRAVAMMNLNGFDRPAGEPPVRAAARHLRPDLADLDPADDPLLPADSEGGAL